MKEGLVSVIIPVFNRAEMLAEAVDSALAQDHRPIEIIIVDDGSDDGETPGVAASFARRHPEIVRVVRQENAGPGAARERGRSWAHGEFIQYLDSDDLLLQGKFTMQIAGLRRHSECGVCYGRTRLRNADGTLASGALKRTGERIATMFPAFLQSRWWSTLTPLWRRAVTDAVGPWLPLRLEEDWEYDCRAAAVGVRLHWCDADLAEVRDHSQERLCHGGRYDPARMRDRATAHLAIWQHALRSGIPATAPERAHFSRELFLLCRQCGAAGLAREARALFDASRKAAGSQRARGADYLLYRMACGLLGWKATGALSCWSDRFRRGSTSAPTP